MTIIPIFKREMVAAARGGQLQAERFALAVLFLGATVATFVTFLGLRKGEVATEQVAQAARQSFILALAVHGTIVGAIFLRGANAIAKEKERKTLDFLLVSRLTSAEIVVGKMVSCLVITLAMYAGGLPVSVVLYQLGCADLSVMLLAHAGMCSTVVELLSLSIWTSVEAPESRRAIAYASLLGLTWLVMPMTVTLLLRSTGLRLPEWVLVLNSWILSSGPVGVVHKIALGKPAWTSLLEMVGLMAGLQLSAAALFLLLAVVRLRPAYRASQSGDEEKRSHAVWRFWPRPPVGDDPILWRAMYTARGGGVAKTLEIVLNSSLLATFGYFTWYYAAPAFVEVWNQGYLSTPAPRGRPELNPFVSLVATAGMGRANDFARVQLNVFIRIVSLLLAPTVTLGVGTNATTEIGSERRRQTWLSLLATPLTGQAIMRSKILAELWRLRGFAIALVALLTIGVLAGAIHPIGYLVSLVEIGAWTWFFAASSVAIALKAKDFQQGATTFLVILPISAAIVLLLPARFNSVFLGCASSVFVLWMSLVSYRDLSEVSLFSAPLRPYMHLDWIGIKTGEGPVVVIVACLVGIAIPAIGGLLAWRWAVNNFDRYVGRPSRSNSKTRP